MSAPIFIDLEPNSQIEELRAYFKELGAETDVENAGDGLVKNLKQVIEASSVLWSDENLKEADIESAMNSIVSLVLYISPDQADPLITLFCDSLVASDKSDSQASLKLKLLLNLFHGMSERSRDRFTVYSALVKVAGQSELLHVLDPQLDKICQWFTLWDISASKQQTLLRSLHEACMACKQTETATKVMIKLLGTYTEDNASKARDDAQRCIVTCLKDPNTFLLDHLLTLKPVKFLEGEPIHDLLTIFVSGNLSQYATFYEQNKDYISSIGLDHEQNMRKMRLLTLMQMCEGKTELDYNFVQDELKFDGQDDLEMFIIEAVKTKTVRVKLNQLAKRIVVYSTTHRTFGRQQWQVLREHLEGWQGNLQQVVASLQQILPPGPR